MLFAFLGSCWLWWALFLCDEVEYPDADLYDFSWGKLTDDDGIEWVTDDVGLGAVLIDSGSGVDVGTVIGDAVLANLLLSSNATFSPVTSLLLRKW